MLRRSPVPFSEYSKNGSVKAKLKTSSICYRPIYASCGGRKLAALRRVDKENSTSSANNYCAQPQYILRKPNARGTIIMAKSSGNRRSKARSESKTQTKKRSGSRSKTTIGRVTKVTTDHDEIRRWAEDRGAKPARVRGTGDVGIIRLAFPGAPGARDEQLEEISWDEWFRKFDESGLAFLFEETTASGQKSNFNKLVKRETVKAKAARA
jgi:hypothetical protein